MDRGYPEPTQDKTQHRRPCWSECYVSKKSVAVSVSRLITEQVTNSALCRLDARYDRRSGRM